MDASLSTASSSSTTVGTSATVPLEAPRIDELVLDAGPLVTQQRLTGLARKYYIPPSVVAELRDQRARDHLEWLRSEAGGACDVEVREAGAEARLAVAAFAKKTGDYAVLSQPDMSVLALTYALEVQRHGQWRIRSEIGGKTGQQRQSAENAALQKGKGQQTKLKENSTEITQASSEGSDARNVADKGHSQIESPSSKDQDAIVDDHSHVSDELSSRMAEATIAGKDEPERQEQQEAVEDGDEASEDDEETGGEWITPENISNHKSRALGLVTESDLSLLQTPAKSKSNGRMRSTVTDANDDGWSTVVSKNTVQQPAAAAERQRSTAAAAAKKAAKPTPRSTVACMTGDYAVQNVLLQMGLSLVGLEGQRIRQVKSWVLRCHACFKICKDSERKFCPQCGNATLLRTSVTSTDPQAAAGKASTDSGGVQVHLKKNFQYKNRGTKYPLPLPKAGKASGAPAAVPILREDQAEWQRAVQRERVQRSKEERALQRALARGSDSLSARYEDADELSILLAGKTNAAQSHGLPALGIGRRNPNEKRRRKV